MLPSPKWTSGRWTLDLRGFGFGQRYTLRAPPPPAGDVLAVHAAYDLLARLRAERPVGPQLALPGAASGPTFARAMREYLARRASSVAHRWRSAGGERYTREICQRLISEFGARPVSDFAPPEGSRLLAGYRDLVRRASPEELHRAGLAGRLGPKRMQDVLGVVVQILSFAAEPERGWISALPLLPDPRVDANENIRSPVEKWVDEATFRAARARIYDDPIARRMLLGQARAKNPAATMADVLDMVERRRLYLSFAFYTGMRRHDLDCLDDSQVSADLGRYARASRKTGAAVSAEACSPPLLADLRAEQMRLGRFWRKGEAICGGPWKNVCRVLAEACDRAGVERFNLRDCRRSFVWHKAMVGVPEADIIRLLGHTDSRMVRAVYQRHLPAASVDRASAAWPRPLSAVPGTGGARVLRLETAPVSAPEEGDLTPIGVPSRYQNQRERDG